jgi:pilus assembly protein Flp/PilA
MSDITTTALELHVRGTNAMRAFVERLQSEERGQTAAEYLGVLVVVSVIIAAVAGTGVGDDIKNWIHDVVQKISGGNSAKG